MGRFEDMQLLDGAGKLPDAFRQEYDAERAKRNAAMAPATSAASGAFTETPDVMAQPDDARRAVQMGGGAAGLVAGGVTGGVPGAISGAAKGMGLAGLGYDIMTGDPDVSRNLVVGVGTTLLNFLPMTKTLRLATSTLANAGGSAAIGAGYDAATGRPITADSVAGDAVAGGVGRLAGEALGRLDAAASANRMAGLRPRAGQAAVSEFTQANGIDVPASAVTNSKTLAKIEQYPQRKMFGAQTGLEFHLRGLQQAEDAVVKQLDALGGLQGDRNATVLGKDVRSWALGLKQTVNRAARQAYRVEAAAIPDPVVPGNLRTIATQIADEQQRTPGGVHPAVRRVLQTTAKVDAETGQPLPMTWEEARTAKGVLNNSAYGRNPLVGNLDSGTRIRLAQALDKDMTDVLEKQPPEVQALSEWTDHAYGLTKKVIAERVQNVLDSKDAEKNLARLFKPGLLEDTQDLKQILPRSVWDRAGSAWLAEMYAKAGGTGRPGQRPSTEAVPGFRPSRFAKLVKPYIDSGQLDEMLPPESAAWVKSFEQFGEAMQSSERLAQNASGTGQAMASDAQAQAIAKNLLGILRAPAIGMAAGAATGLGAAVGGAMGAANELVTPWAANKLAYTRPGQALMTRLVNGPDPTATSRTLFRHFLAQTGMQGEKP